MTSSDDARGPDRETVLTALCNAISASAAAVPEGEATFSLDADMLPGSVPEIALSTASGAAGLTIARLDGRDLTAGEGGLTLVERLERAEPLVAALETLLGLEFSPAETPPEKMAATIRITVRDGAGEVLHILALGLSGAVIDALPLRENTPPALRHALPVLVDLIVMVGARAGDLAEGDVLLLGGASGGEAILHVPEPVGAFGVDVEVGGARIAAAAKAPGGGPAFRIAGLRLSVQAVVEARRGGSLTIPPDLAGHLHMVDGAAHDAQLVSIGEAIGIRVGPPAAPESREAA